MARLVLITIIFTVITAWSHAEVATPSDDAGVREPRHLFRKKCYKYGTCGGYQGGYNGYQGGYQGYQGGHQGYGSHPPINIAISQSQSGTNGGYPSGGGNYGPNNYQYNYNPGHGGSGYGGPGYGGPGYGGYHRPGYFRPGYVNGPGSYNNQFNGNYNGGGGYGFNGPFFDENSDEKPIHENDSAEGDENFAFAGAYARSASGKKID